MVLQKDEFKSKAFFVVVLVKPDDYDCAGVGTIAPPPGQFLHCPELLLNSNPGRNLQQADG